ncbi:MAG TPA: exodeoxyribonuclease III [Myxococcales bacterium]|nr:exodeoxyribonuclease III [Myxococcales bacterium]
MKIATWNINGLRARLEFVRAWLTDRKPDVVGIQELKLEDEKFPHAAFEEVGYHAVCHGQKAWNGVAILSREKAEVVARGLPGQEDFGSRLITANIQGLNFTTVYCPNGKSLEHEDYARKLAWYESLADHLSQKHDSKSESVVSGDFNICPAPLDGWMGDASEGEIFHTEAERNRLQALFDMGLYDLFRHKYPNERTFSWWDYRGGSFHRGHGLRIDFLLGTKGVRDRLKDVMIDREWRKKKQDLTASDHAPVVATLL